MPAVKVGVREFREQIARYLESDTPVAVTLRGETLGVYVPDPRRRVKAVDLGELKSAADRLAAALAGMSEEDVSPDFKEWRRRKKNCRLLRSLSLTPTFLIHAIHGAGVPASFLEH